MKPALPNPAMRALREEMKGTAEARYHHRLHAVLLVLAGMSARQVASILDEPPRTIAEWVQRFRVSGIEGLKSKTSPGRRPRLTQEQLAEIQKMPATTTGRVLSDWIADQYGIHIEVRQCQRLIKKLPSKQA